MEHWLEILFGGVGGTILIAVVGWLWSKRASARREQTPHVTRPKSPDPVDMPIEREIPAQPVSSNDDNMSPTRIATAIRAASPFARPTIAGNFVGTRVQWDLWLQQILHGAGGKKVRVRMSDKENGSFPQILCDVGVDTFPFLKWVHEGSLMRVKGELEEVSELQLILTEVELTLLQAKLGES